MHGARVSFLLHNFTFGRIKRTYLSYVKIQLPLGLKRKFSFSHFRKKFRFIGKISLGKLRKIAETLLIGTLLGEWDIRLNTVS
jgi:hypothetical protein